MKRRNKLLVGVSGFAVLVMAAIAGFSGSAQLALHAGFWITLVFAVWLEAHLPESRA